MTLELKIEKIEEDYDPLYPELPGGVTYTYSIMNDGECEECCAGFPTAEAAEKAGRRDLEEREKELQEDSV